MGIIEICFIGVGLAMDAFAVAVCKGLSMKNFCLKKAFIIACYFGFFQAFMPMIGYFLGVSFEHVVEAIDHWIAFFLLGIIGIKMISESFNSEVDNKNEKTDLKTMLVLSVATSIDALAVGITFAFLKVNILLSITLIGSITLLVTLFGVKIGNKFGDKLENKAEIVGGIILIIIGLKILLEHLVLWKI